MSNSSWKSIFRVLVGLMVVASVLVLGDHGASAVQFPVTLSEQKPVLAGPVVPDFSIDYLGVVWEKPETGGSAVRSDNAVEPYGGVRFLDDGTWGPWIPLVEDGVQVPSQWGSSLVAGGDAEAYQVRGVPTEASSPRAVAINTTDGPLTTVGHRPSGASALTNCLSRAEWGADEALRYVDGEESWPTTFYPVQVLTVHHTVTANDDPNPAATVRAIYTYHTVDRGWGDIAYHHLIDEDGRIYEGRWSGEESAPCEGGGDGSDFGYNMDGELVTAGHTYCYNGGNLGVALLGDFTGVEPKPAARSGLEDALAEFLTRPDDDLDPLGIVSYMNPAPPGVCPDPVAVSVDTIAAHRDWPSPAGDTACPGDTFYPHLPGVRANVALLMGLEPPSISVALVAYSTSGGRNGDKDLSVAISLEPPLSGAVVSATVNGPDSFTGTVPTDGTGTAVIFIKNAEPGCYVTDITGVDAPGRVWDEVPFESSWGCDPPPTTTTTTTLPQGDIQIDGIDPATVLSGSTARATITGSGFVDGATVTFSGGVGPPPIGVVLAVDANGMTITLDIVTTDLGPKKDRYWDVTVANPDGGSSTMADGLMVSQ